MLCSFHFLQKKTHPNALVSLVFDEKLELIMLNFKTQITDNQLNKALM